MKIGSGFTRFIKIVSILTVFLMIFAIFYSIKSRMGSKREIKEGEDPYLISNLFDKEWTKNKFWLDSTEKAYYTCMFKVDENPTLPFYLEMNVSKEFYNEEFKVKSSDKERLDLVEVFQNQLIASKSFTGTEGSFMGILAMSAKNPLEVYNYKQSALSYDGILLRGYEKLKTTGYKFYYNTYLDKEAIGEREMNENFLFEDQLFFLLRSVKFNSVDSFASDVMESQMQAKIGRTHVYKAKFNVVKMDDTQSYTVRATFDGEKVNEYAFEQKFPNRLIYAKLWNGMELNLNNYLNQKK